MVSCGFSLKPVFNLSQETQVSIIPNSRMKNKTLSETISRYRGLLITKRHSCPFLLMKLLGWEI